MDSLQHFEKLGPSVLKVCGLIQGTPIPDRGIKGDAGAQDIDEPGAPVEGEQCFVGIERRFSRCVGGTGFLESESLMRRVVKSKLHEAKKI